MKVITPAQIRAARAMLGLKQQELADAAGLSNGTLNNIERGAQTDPKLSTLRSIQTALEAKGIEFTEREPGCYGIQLKPTHNIHGTIDLLIIDDSMADRKLYKIWLKKNTERKYAVSEAANAADGYAMFLKMKPACIILDFMMYGINGFQMLVDMQKAHTDIPPIIFVTAMHNDMLEKEVRALGVHSYLDKKTLTAEKLYAAIANALPHYPA